MGIYCPNRQFLFCGNIMNINIDFINPNKTDLTMTATVGCGYSYIDYQSSESR